MDVQAFECTQIWLQSHQQAAAGSTLELPDEDHRDVIADACTISTNL